MGKILCKLSLINSLQPQQHQEPAAAAFLLIFFRFIPFLSLSLFYSSHAMMITKECSIAVVVTYKSNEQYFWTSSFFFFSSLRSLLFSFVFFCQTGFLFFSNKFSHSALMLLQLCLFYAHMLMSWVECMYASLRKGAHEAVGTL